MNSTKTRRIYDTSRLIALHGIGSYRWYVLIKPSKDTAVFEEELREELDVQSGTPLRIIQARGENVDGLVSSLRNPNIDVVLLKGLEEWSDNALKTLDIRRSALNRPGLVILWLSPQGLARLFQQAPNIRSWIGGTGFPVDADLGFMTEEDRRERLLQLSSEYGLKDDQVISMAKSGKLPPDPHFAEWLILLGRAELVG